MTRLDDAMDAALRAYIPPPAPTEETHDKLYVVGFHDPAYPDDPVVGVALNEADARQFAIHDLGAARAVNEFHAVIWKPKITSEPLDLGNVEVKG